MGDNINYRKDIDLLKGIAILAVILYHANIIRSGYLGVDAFLVINGFLIVPKVVKEVGVGHFHYPQFLAKRIFRLMPLILVISVASLIVGYWGMLPDDYENLSESVIAASLFSNNILSAITTKNYWDAVNEYKPLMHTWYIGILFEFYLVLPIIAYLLKYIAKWFKKDFYRVFVVGYVLLSSVSLLLYFSSSVSDGDRFYLLPCRFFELALGGLVGVWMKKTDKLSFCSHHVMIEGVCFVFLVLIMFWGCVSFSQSPTEYNLVNGLMMSSQSFIPKPWLLIFTVILSLIFLISDNENNRLITCLESTKIFNLFGKMSYSLFIWHQPLLAFYRYFFTDEISVGVLVLIFILTFAISYLSYSGIEKKVRPSKVSYICMLISFILINGFSYKVYASAGVMRDVPELYVRKTEVHGRMFAEYNDRVYQYDKDFSKDNQGKINVLVVGNSFARDWCNILLESDVSDKINLSYKYDWDNLALKRVQESDYIFVFGHKHNVPATVWKDMKADAGIWGIGTKSFGASNGTIYKKRNKDNYFEQTIKIKDSFFVVNDILKAEWGSHYIDLLSLVIQKDSTIRVFSDDKKFISQDCRHLSLGGAKYYAQRIDFSKIFTKAAN